MPYESLVNFQVQEWGGKIEKVGNQIGEPWAGNTKTVPILFVSRRLTYVSNEICSRYVSNDSQDGYGIACIDKTFQNGCFVNCDMNANEVMKCCN